MCAELVEAPTCALRQAQGTCFLLRDANSDRATRRAEEERGDNAFPSPNDDEVGALQGAIRAERALASEAVDRDKPASLATRSLRQTLKRVMSGTDACRPGGQLRRSRV